MIKTMKKSRTSLKRIKKNQYKETSINIVEIGKIFCICRLKYEKKKEKMKERNEKNEEKRREQKTNPVPKHRLHVYMMHACMHN